jgi:hypothetical protein
LGETFFSFANIFLKCINAAGYPDAKDLNW